MLSPHRVRSARATRVSGRQAGVAAGEDQPQQVVLDDLGPGVLLGQPGVGERPSARASFGPRAASRRIRSTARRRAVVRSQATRVVRDAVARPGLQGAQAGVLHGILGEREVAGPAGEGGEDVAARDPHDLGQGAVRVLGGERSRPRATALTSGTR